MCTSLLIKRYTCVPYKYWYYRHAVNWIIKIKSILITIHIGVQIYIFTHNLEWVSLLLTFRTLKRVVKLSTFPRMEFSYNYLEWKLTHK